MKAKMVALAVSLIVFITGQASALTPDVKPDVVLLISGSSSLQKLVGAAAMTLFVNGITSTSRTDVYYDGSVDEASGNYYRGYFGIGSTNLPASLQGKRILVLHSSLGESFAGIDSLAKYKTIFALNPSNCVMPNNIYYEANRGISVYSCPGAGSYRVPDAAISDVEPAILQSQVNLPPNNVSLSNDQLLSLTTRGLLGAVIGIPVTSNAPASLKSLSKAQVAGLMGGNVYDWSMIDPAATGKSIIVCRRAAGSSEQVVVNANIFGAPCMSSPLYPLVYSGTSAPMASVVPVAAGNVVVVENSSSGNVKSCLQSAKNGTAAGKAINVKYGNIVDAGTPDSVVLPAGNYGIGVLGLGEGTTANYNFAAINGSAATVANASNGSYDLIGVATLNDRGDLVGVKADLFYAFAVAAADPSVLGVGGAAGAPIPGVAALSENGWDAHGKFTNTYPVLRVSNFGETCAPWVAVQ